MTAKTVHVPVRGRNTPVAHHDGDLVQCLRQRGPEVPVVAGAVQIRARIAFDGVVQVGNLRGLRRKNTGVLLPTRSQFPSLGIELDRKAADIALGVGRSALARHGGKTGENSVFFPTVENSLALV